MRMIREPVLYAKWHPWFVLLASLDIMLTWVVLSCGGVEVNNLAAAVIEAGGLTGMIIYKFVIVAVVLLICEYVGRRRDELGLLVARSAVVLNSIPVMAALVQLHLWAQWRGGENGFWLGWVASNGGM